MEYTFLNEQKHYETLLSIFMDVLKDHEATDYEWFAEQEAESLAASHVKDMAKYVHMSDTKICGNFANIREDWDYIPDFVKSEVKPWGKIRRCREKHRRQNHFRGGFGKVPRVVFRLVFHRIRHAQSGVQFLHRSWRDCLL